MKRRAKVVTEESATKQVVGFIGKFSPRIAKLIRSVRAALRGSGYQPPMKLFTTTTTTIERPSDSIVSLAANAKGSWTFVLSGSDTARSS